ncbi:MAG: TadE family protein [Nocardioides sp.]
MTIPNRRRPVLGRGLRRRDERGIAAPEFVVIMPLVMLIFLMLVQWSVQLYNDRIVHAAAREAAVDAASWEGTEDAGRQTANEYLADSGSDLSNTSVKINVGATEVTVTVSGEVMTLLPGFTKRVSATATVPRERFAE